MSHTLTLIPGDGIGPEVTEAVVRIFKSAGVDIDWERQDAGVTAFKRHNQSLPGTLLDSIRRNKVALKGPVTTPIAEGFTSVNVGLRKALDLYANLRPVRNLPGVQTRFSDVDLIIVRENTEDLYAGLEHQIIPGVVESLKIITEKASTRIAAFAFDYARKNGRKRVTAVHKANIGLDTAVFEAVHGSAPDIADKNLANPTALLLSGLMMLDYLGEHQRAERIRAALGRVLQDGAVRTHDLGGHASTTEFTEAVCREVEKGRP